MSFDSLFNKNVPRELELLMEIIDGVYDHLKKRKYIVTNSKSNWTEYGFYFHNTEITANIFLGIWFDIWETHQSPLCFCLDWTKGEMNGDLLVLRLKKFQEKHSDLFDKVVIFENTPTICFKQTYVNSIENELVLIKILSELMNDLGLNTTGIIK